MTDFPIPHELLSPSAEFEAASEQIGLFWWYWNHRDRRILVSQGLLNRLGIESGTFDQTIEAIYQKIHPDDIPKNRQRIEKLVNGESNMYEIEYRVKDLKGGWKWYYNRGTVIERDDQGGTLIIGGITVDISGEFQHLLSMVEEKDKFEFIFRNSMEAALILKFQNGRIERINDANQAALELFHLDRTDIMQKKPEKLLKGQMMKVGELMYQQIKEKGSARFEESFKTKGSGTQWLEFTAHEFSLTNEDLILAIVTDKTSSRKTEAALRETEKMYRTLFEAANDRIGLYTACGKPLLINNAFHEAIGYSREELMAMEWEETVHPDDLKQLREEGPALFEQGFSGHEYRVRHKDGHYLHMSAKAVLIQGDHREEDLVLYIIRDISDRNKFIKELEQAKQAAEVSDKLKSAFLANMSHEIRTPMNSIVGFSNLLVNDKLNQQLRETYVQRIVRNSELLLALISDIIDLAKIESGQLPLIYGRFSVSDLMEDMRQYALEELQRMENKHLEIIIEQEVENQEMEIDVVRIAQVMKNLINNAIKFTDQGSVTIGAKGGKNKKQIVLYVRDTGIGIDSEHFGLIFDEFRQVDGSKTRRFGGTGLGLAICKNLVRMMNGRIWVESQPGTGALFQVELPLEASREISVDESSASNLTPAARETDPLHIMVVDDEPDSVDLMGEMLSSLGHHVIKAQSGYEALQLLEQSSLPDLIFMDDQMPVLSGTETLRIMKERYQGIRVVAQSAHALLGDRDRFLRNGYNEYLAKPFTRKQLESIIGEVAGE